ncbi:MAG: hypothetical protein ABIY52_14175 [Gemmatimonadaceae bacterium]
MTVPGAQRPQERATPVLSPRYDIEHDGGASLGAYVATIRRHMRIVVALPLALAAIALTTRLLSPREYAARSAFIATEPSSSSGSLGSLSSIASQLGIPALSAIASGSATLGAQFYGDLLSSTALTHALVTTRFDASAPAEYGGKPFSGTLIEYFDGSAKTQMDRELDAMRRASKRMISVSVDRPTGVVRFTVTTKNRQLSALVARRVLDLVNDFNLRRRQTQAGAEREFAARRAATALDSLHRAEASLAEFRTTNIDFSRSPRLATRETELQRRVTLAQQIYTTVSQRYEVANLEAVRNTPVITVLDAPEGLVESMPRHTAAITLAAFAAGLVIAIAYALNAERLKAPR